MEFGGAWPFHRRERMTVVFADGHAKSYTPSNWGKAAMCVRSVAASSTTWGSTCGTWMTAASLSTEAVRRDAGL
jgi:prepilin-type processing-associated H-X9-DG protein